MFDNTPDKRQNDTNVDNNEVIRLDEQQPLNDVNCEHDLQPDSDTIGQYKAWKCVKCHRGVFLPKNATIT